MNPTAVVVMKEDGIDISNQTSKTAEQFLNNDFDFIITVCDNAKESCPVFPSRAKRFHQNFPDPARAEGIQKEKLKIFRNVRQMIKDYCKAFVKHNI